MTQAQGGEEFLATFANVHTHSQAYEQAIFLLISPWKEHAMCLEGELQSVFCICLPTFQLHLYYYGR